MTSRYALYADLSGHYDRFCLDVDPTAQCDFASRAARPFGLSDGHACLDLACGTGQYLPHLTTRGFSGTGLDNSQASQV